MPSSPKLSLSRRAFIFFWKKLCALTMKVFYRSYEVIDEDSLPENTGIILCVNHVNALIDAAVLQASTDKNIRALARDGLFKNPFLKPILRMIGTVPIYRRETEQTDTSKNQDTFARCYELLAENQTLVIFPEGQSHSKPYIQEIKTGAARMALGAIQENGIAPVVIPVGMTFSRQKRARTEVLVHYGKPIDLNLSEGINEYDSVHLITERVQKGIEAVTLNTKSWQDLDLVKRLEQFFSLRTSKTQGEKIKNDATIDNSSAVEKINPTIPNQSRKTLSERFQALQQLIELQDLLKQHEPEKIRSLMSKLRVFERLCQACGISNYHLAIKYQPLLLTLYTIRTLGIVLISFPIALWGILNSIIPYTLTQFLTKKISKKVDQHDTTWVMLGMLFFGILWGGQCNYVYTHFGFYWSLFYLSSIILGSALALNLKGEYQRTIANLKVFFLFLRKKDLRNYLETKRQELEAELAHMVRITKRLSKADKLD
ncbi:MAG: glycerol-3-phosphate O-acyltransferase/dihydroxyacetone phosphate acyltransferase [Cocleimonas sp.]|jgi:glycerol-3-phosphate O-acyltransferase/dihydroxyacetone phosphate acyltransferase